MVQLGLDYEMKLQEVQDRLDAAVLAAVDYYSTVQGVRLDILRRDPITDELHRAVTHYMLGYAQGIFQIEHVKRAFQHWLKSCEVTV
jgi:hypothetical protein